ncbi:MAG TPA: nuclear transport factor 2 family protein [Steroidobacteraceae bacterium]|nr:nuclear transport factor 2 family protein [Steroidobacteraceae bacterium]
MTIDELLARESIRRTMAAYTMAGDRLKVEDFIAVFTEDAIFESEGVAAQDLFRYEGRAAIRDWLAGWSSRAAARPPSLKRPTFIRHHLSTCQIELTGSAAAKARTYWVAYTDIGPDHGGYYVDSFRKVDDRWLIAHRKVRLDWRLPESLFASGPP